MAQEGPNRLAEWLLLLRAQLPVVRQHFEEWLAAVREEPALIWETLAVRYAAYAAGGLVLVWLTVWAAEMITPPPPESARPAATAAVFHVVCADAACAHHFAIHRKFGFSKFPVDCPKCERKTGIQARRCGSQDCRERWVAPLEEDGETYCSVCGRQFD